MYQVNERVVDVFIILNIQFHTCANGSEYMTAILRKGNEKTKCIRWNADATLHSLTEGGFVFVDGKVSEYRDDLQITAEAIYPLKPSDVTNRAAVIPTAPIDADLCYKELVNTASAMKDLGLRKLCLAALEQLKPIYLSLPAGKSIHHAFVGGLLMHVISMLRMAKAFCDIVTWYPDRDDIIDRDLLYAGVILHDIGKIGEFRVMECGLVSDYTSEGRQFGHTLIGVNIINNLMSQTNAYSDNFDQLQHMLYSHHGALEYGAAVEPMTLEALVLSLLDSLDSKAEAVIEALERTEKGSFTEKLFAFNGRQFYRVPEYDD